MTIRAGGLLLAQTFSVCCCALFGLMAASIPSSWFHSGDQVADQAASKGMGVVEWAADSVGVFVAEILPVWLGLMVAAGAVCEWRGTVAPGPPTPWSLEGVGNLKPKSSKAE